MTVKHSKTNGLSLYVGNLHGSVTVQLLNSCFSEVRQAEHGCVLFPVCLDHGSLCISVPAYISSIYLISVELILLSLREHSRSRAFLSPP